MALHTGTTAVPSVAAAYWDNGRPSPLPVRPGRARSPHRADYGHALTLSGRIYGSTTSTLKKHLLQHRSAVLLAAVDDEQFRGRRAGLLILQNGDGQRALLLAVGDRGRHA